MRLYLLIFLVLLSNCTYFNTTDEKSNDEQHIVKVKLEIIAPFSKASISIIRNGDLRYEAESPKTGVEKQVVTKNISLEEFEELSDLINNNFWSLEQEYIDESLMDATTYILTIWSFPAWFDPALAEPGEYSVKCYGKCPQQLIEIINKIKQLWGQQILEVGV